MATINPLPEYPELILALDLLDTTPPRFHWLIFIPDEGATRNELPVRAGTKLHAITNGQQGAAQVWSYDHVPFNLATTPSVAVAAILGHLPAGKTATQLSHMLKEIPMAIPAVDSEREPRFTCRVWLREAVRRMHAAGYISCPDVDALEAEMWEYGKAAAEKIEGDTFVCAALRTAVNARTV